MRLLLTTSVLAMLGLAACSTAPTTMVKPEPTFNKMGDGECTEGYLFDATGAPFEGECIPEDERPPEDDDDPRDPTFTGTPTGSTPTGRP